MLLRRIELFFLQRGILALVDTGSKRSLGEMIAGPQKIERFY
jgi:hypothetical protein